MAPSDGSQCTVSWVVRNRIPALLHTHHLFLGPELSVREVGRLSFWSVCRTGGVLRRLTVPMMPEACLMMSACPV